MKRTTCPFLGLQEDPTTALNFPSQGNFCHHALPIAPVKGTHQEQFCLSENHIQCPLFQAAEPQPMPEELIAPDYSVSRMHQILTMVGVPALLAGTAALAIIISGFGNRIINPSIPIAGANLAAPGEWSLLNTRQTASPTSPATTASPNPQKTNCPIPMGWAAYTVNPTDSLYRLSVIYGVSMDVMQQANCMGNNTTIFPGQVILVPFLPTNTPTQTPTATLVPALPAALPANVQGDSNQPSSPTVAPAAPSATPVPPAAPPPQPTPVPPPQGGISNPGQGGSGGQGGNQGNGGGHGNGGGQRNGGGNGNGHGNGKKK